MKFVKVDSYEKLSRMGADIIAAQIILKPNCVLGLATGSSPLGIYANLIEDNKNGKIDFSEVTSINLDEYLGLTGDNDQSYRYFMDNNLFNHVNIKKENTFVPNAVAADIEKECKEYDQRILDKGGIDIQLLGIGLDGHIGFNEPDTSFTKETHTVTLDESTIVANARFFERKRMFPVRQLPLVWAELCRRKRFFLLLPARKRKKL